MMYFLDTSAVLNGALTDYPNCYISPIVVSELEHIKTSETKNEHTKFLARQAVNKILTSDMITWSTVSQKKINKLLKCYSFLSDIPDHRLICEALIVAQEIDSNTTFITSDGAQALFVKELPQLQLLYYQKDNIAQKDMFCGWGKYYPTAKQFEQIYTSPEFNVLNAQTNEFCELYEGDELKDVQFWNGEHYRQLKYREFKNMLGEKIAPRNLEQKMLFHLLQDTSIKIKLCQSTFGGGKTWCMLQHALKGIQDGTYSKIIFVRNNIITKGSRDIGFLGGSLVEKIMPYLMPIADLTSKDYMDDLIANDILVPVPLGFMRGRDFSNNTLVFCDEAENLTKENVQLLIGRIGEGSELWMAGDLKQIDHQDFEKNNGMRAMIQGLAGNPLFGTVKLLKSERSKTSQLADLLD